MDILQKIEKTERKVEQIKANLPTLAPEHQRKAQHVLRTLERVVLPAYKKALRFEAKRIVAERQRKQSE